MADDDDMREFSASERRRLRKMMEAQERAEWMWATIRVWVTWIAAILAGIYATFEFVIKHVRLKIGG